MSKANEVPRLTRAHQVAIRDEARRLSEWHGRTISPLAQVLAHSVAA